MGNRPPKPMEPTEEAKRLIQNVLSRRTFMFAAGGAVTSFSLFGLAGCGGQGSHRSSSGGGAIVGASGKVTFILPAGVTATTLICATGWGSVTGLTKPVTVPYMQSNVTLALVLDPSNGKLVMAGMIDATAGSHTVDATNVAATLIFLKMGGVQTPFAIRPALWTLVLADPATATLASVVQARLNANPYAIDDQDPALLSALQSAVDSLSSATIAGLTIGGETRGATRAKSRSGGSSTVSVDPPIPALGIDLGNSEADETRILASFNDLLIRVNAMPREGLAYLYDAAQTNASGVADVFETVRLVGGPTPIPGRIVSESTGFHQDFAVNLAHPTDLGRHLIEIRLTPVFDATVDDFVTDTPGSASVYAPHLDIWRSALVPMYQRVAVQVAIFSFLEALGRGGVQLSGEQLATATTRMNALGSGVASAIAQAGLGQDLIGSANGIITAAIADSTSVAGMLEILHDLFGIRVNDINTSLLQSTYRLSNWVDILGSPGSDYTRMCTHKAFDRTFDQRVFSSVYVDSLTLTKNVYTIVPATAGYSVGGGPVALSLHDTLNESLDANLQRFRKYRWKLTGPGNGTLNDGVGNSGRDITSTTLTIAFIPGSSTQGDQVVTVDVINLESANAVKTAAATLTLSPTLFQLLPNTPTVDFGAQQLFQLQRNDGEPFPGGATFRWTLVGTGSLAGGSPATTSTPTIYYSAPSAPGQDTITVEAFDPQGASLGKVATTITVSTPSRITPFNPYVRHGGTQTFTVAPLTGSYPGGATFTWTLSGSGRIGGSNTVKTSTPSIDFTAPSSDASATLSVAVADSTGKTIAKTATNITISNTQIVNPTVQWFETSTYSGPDNYEYGEYYGLVLFRPITGATKYVVHVVDSSIHQDEDVATMTAAEYAGGAPVWDPTTTLYEHPDPSSYPIPYGGKHHDYPVEEDRIYNAQGGLAKFIGGGQHGDAAGTFEASYHQELQVQKDAAARRTYSVIVSF